MNEMTAWEAAKILESTDFIEESAQDAIDYAASILRRVASGELAEVVHGHWEEVEPGHDVLFKCSNCGRVISTSWGCCEDEDTKGCNGCDPTEEWLSCPSCGALMDGKDDSR